MIFNDLKLFLPELILILGFLITFGLDQFLHKSKIKRSVVAITALLTFTFAMVTLLEMTGVATGIKIFSNMVVIDKFSIYFKCIFLLTAFIGTIFSFYSKEVEEHAQGEYFGILIGMVIAMFLLVSSTNLLMLFLSIEFLSITSYILTAFKKSNKQSSEAALKYVVYGAFASGIMLFGMSYLYGLVGSLDMSVIGTELSVLITKTGLIGSTKIILVVAFVSVFAGFAYKIASVPFHMWCPDIYQGAPTPVTAILSVGPKAAGFAALIRFLSMSAPEAIPWQAIVGILAAATMTVGNLTAIVQSSVKRLLAYSSIAHAGYMLMAVAAFSQDSIFAVMFYMSIYLLMNLGAFIVVMAINDQTGSDDISMFKGLGSTRPVLAITLTIFLFSLVGLPPLAGFIGKFYLFVALIKKASFWFYVLALIGVINSAISLFYYAKIVKAMFFEKQDDEITFTGSVRPQTILAVILSVPVLILGIYWTPLADFTTSFLR